ncbi:MAG: tetratricopeptide repeat protein [Chloroflexi bacterium]|nr:tetratricopeptide repeat protein [Chloroflexota bacterium]
MQSTPDESEVPQGVNYWIVLAHVALLQEAWESKDGMERAQRLVASLLGQDIPQSIRARALRLSSIINSKLGQTPEALNGLNEAVLVFESIGDRLMTASTLRDTGGIYFAMGNFRDALQSYEKAVALMKESKEGFSQENLVNEDGEAESGVRVFGLPLSDSLRAVAGLYARTGRINLAIKPLEEMLEEGRKGGNIRVQAEALSELGLAYRRIGRLKDAEMAYREAIPLMEQLRAIPGRAHDLCGLGMTLEQGGNIRESEPFFRQSLQLFEQIGDKYGQAKLWHCLARFHHHARNYELSQNLYLQSLQYYRDVGYIANTGPVLLDLAKLKNSLGQYQDAVNFCEEAKSIFTNLEDQTGIAVAFVDLGITYYIQGQQQLSLQNWKQARSIYEKVSPSLSEPVNGTSNFSDDSELIVLDDWVNWLSMYDPTKQRLLFEKLSLAVTLLGSSD